jgi:hypothetical protein
MTSFLELHALDDELWIWEEDAPDALSGDERTAALHRLARALAREDPDIFDTVLDELGGSPCADPDTA